MFYALESPKRQADAQDLKMMFPSMQACSGRGRAEGVRKTDVLGKFIDLDGRFLLSSACCCNDVTARCSHSQTQTLTETK